MNHQAASHVWVKASAVDDIRNPKTNRFNGSAKIQPRVPSFSFSETDSDTGSVAGSVVFTSGRIQQWGWMAGTMCAQSSSSITIKLNDDGSTVQMKANALEEGLVVLGNDYEKDPSGDIAPPNDLITLTHLHEPAVVHCLKHRYARDTIYTATGPVLLALNPFKSIRGMYGESTMKKYWDKAENNLNQNLPPHVYEIADSSFRNMMRQMEQNVGLENASSNQAILVSGESGAGKTVTTKFVMKYLAALSQRSTVTSAPLKRAYLKVEEKRDQARSLVPTTDGLISFGSNSIESKVLQSNPILESFGNARTIRNDNSSRFGKFIEIQFTQTGKLVGATIETYLLEKVRLVTQSPGERNYHVFFELLQGMEAGELRNLYLAHTATPADFRMMHSGTVDRRDGVTDRETYRALRSAMNVMNLQDKEQKNIFSVTAALLHASNLDLIERDNDQSALDFGNVHLEPVCRLLGITPDSLNEALCTFSIQAGRDGYVRRSLSQHKAQKQLEALIKATYGAMFQYLVMRINDSIAYNPEDEEDIDNRPAATIGVLDIFGFESFTTNSFEQLCINYCNEALQQQFNAFVLKNEQEEYEREGIDWSFIEFPENQDVLDLIDKRGSGILNILDDQCRAPGTSDRSFASDVYSKCSDHPRFRANRKQVALFRFEVNHYAGFVEYTTDNFIEKNRDEMHRESTELLANSTNPFVAFLSEVLTGEASPVLSETSSDLSTPNQLRRNDSSSMKATVGGQFRRQLRDLRSKIDKTSPHYIRCLKPNDHLIEDEFDPVIVAEQLRCGGILEAVRVSRAGFPQHYPHADFVKRYRCVAAKDIKKSSATSASTSKPAWAVPVPQKKWQPPRGATFRNSFPPPVNARTTAQESGSKDMVNHKDACKELLKIIARKIQAYEKEENKENGSPENDMDTPPRMTEPAAKAKSYSTNSSSPSWAKNGGFSTPNPSSNGLTAPNSIPSVKGRYQPWTNQEKAQSTPPIRATIGFRRGNTVDLCKVGIQMGKTKIFLRHKAFETLERMRSRDLTSAANKLNAVFRMYLSRLAYIPVRDAYRDELRARGFFCSSKESKEDDPVPYNRQRTNVTQRGNSSASNLIAQYESEVRACMHNFLNPSQEEDEEPKKLFKWILREGIWVKNKQIHAE